MPTYKLLSRTNPEEYDAALFEQLELLYEGGFRLVANASSILYRELDEPQPVHQERCRTASYIPYLGQIIDQLTSWLFVDAPVVRPPPDAENPDTPGVMPDPDFYSQLQSDADNAGNDFSAMLRVAAATSLLKRRAIIGVDFPKIAPDQVATFRSLADERAAGADRAYLYEVPLESLIHWERNRNGSFKWCVLQTVSVPQDGPLDPADEVVETFKVWSMVEGFAHWDQYEIRYAPDKRPGPDADVPLVDSGDTAFTSIPLVELQLPKGLWAGNKIGPMCREHFRERSGLLFAEHKSLSEIPVFKQGPEMSAVGQALPSELQQNPGRGTESAASWRQKGFVVIGKDDDMEFRGPSGRAFEIVSSQLTELKDEIFRVVHLMAASIPNSASTLGRSGLSKQQDKADTAIVLKAVGEKVLRFAVRILSVVSQGRGEDVRWEAKGLSNYESEDRDSLVAEAAQADLVNIPSPTWKTAYKTQLALQLVKGLTPEAQATIRAEIVEGVAHEQDLRSMMAAATNDSRGPDAPAGTVAAGLVPPGGVPQPGGATADGKVGQSKAAKMAGMPSEASEMPMAHVAAGTAAIVKPLGPAGQPLMPDDAHLQDGAHVDAQTIYDLVSDDYRTKDIEWILSVPWLGPVEVPLTSIDSTNKDRWQASQPEDADHVQHFLDKLQAGEQLKPIILVNNPSNDSKMLIVDGHHRFLAYLMAGVPAVAYVGQVGSHMGDWTLMHDSQKGGGGSSQQVSRQVSGQSRQTSAQASRQASLQASRQK